MKEFNQIYFDRNNFALPLHYQIKCDMPILRSNTTSLAPSGRKPEKVGGSLRLHYWVCVVNELTYQEFAWLTGESKANVSNHASGKSFPREKTLLRYAEALNVDVRDLFNGTWPGREMKHTGNSKKGWGKVSSDALPISNPEQED